MDKQYFVYILANYKNGTLYVGVTNDLYRRVTEHKQGRVKGFTQRYKVYKLVYYEVIDNVYNAITREKQIKKWYRKWKIELIEKYNKKWEDLYYNLFDGSPGQARR
ncbi:MAG: GIY-YIG nuclease family protein [Patescibacteria group bacterium]